jgi:hypothetical protein
MRNWIQVESRAGTPIQVGDRRLVLFSRVVRVHLPGINGGLIWNRPAAVLTTAPDGEELVLPVPDLTRQAQIGILGGVLLAAWLLWFFRRR